MLTKWRRSWRLQNDYGGNDMGKKKVGRPQMYGEPTEQLRTNVPVSQIKAFRKMATEWLKRFNAPFAEKESQQDAFTEACRPLIKYLAENHHPHTTVILNSTGAELLEGQKVTGEILDYLRD